MALALSGAEGGTSKVPPPVPLQFPVDTPSPSLAVALQFHCAGIIVSARADIGPIPKTNRAKKKGNVEYIFTTSTLQLRDNLKRTRS